MANVKLLSAWFGRKPPWYEKFAARMRSFARLHWECIPGDEVPVRSQEAWMNDLASRHVGFACGKRGALAMCDYRPLYGELFAAKYQGYDWWGWCDLDMYLGDMDRLLPGLLTEDVDVLHFKPDYLSGCLVFLRNELRLTSLWRTGRFREVLSDSRYHVWDESGYRYLPGESFYNLLVAAGMRIVSRMDLMSYDSKAEPHPVRIESGKVFGMDGNEKLFHHFMTDIWPERNP